MAEAALKIEAEEEISIERMALDDAGGDLLKAVELLTDRISAEPHIVGPEQIAAWAKSWAYSKVHSLVAMDRRRAIHQPSSSERFSTALTIAANAELTRMMSTPLFGGKIMRDATVDEVRESARRYGLLAQDTARKSRWQEMVADAAEKKRGKTIGDALDEKTLVRLWDEADA